MITSETRNEALQAFYAEADRQWLSPHWLREGGGNEPRADVRPWLWAWDAARACLLRAAEVMPVGDEGAERRAMTMSNPSLKGRPSTTRTLVSAIQLVYPGEEAPSHRHTNAALRFIIEGDGAYTIVDGQPISMDPGDFVITPSWSWHGHAHNGAGPMLWLDVLDAPLIGAMDWRFYEEWGAAKQLQPAEAPRDAVLRRYGGGGLLPAVARHPAVPYSPLFSYKWAPTREALARLTEDDADPFDGRGLYYTNPSTGGPVMPTIDASIHLLPAGHRTRAHRHTTNTIYHVAEGSGYSVIGGVRFDWKRSDTFCVPNWAWHEHAAGPEGDAALFAASDLPILEALGVYREQAYEPNGGHQTVTGGFDVGS
ncbi:MAG TPA: cupin domain-containing protein [Chloroflexota bacterium]|jgi:gentisate 1,2-dioxygenase